MNTFEQLSELWREPIKRGSVGAEVRFLQQALISIGFYYGAVDGEYGARSENAVRSVQQVLGLKPSGVVDRTTWDALLHPSAKGMKVLFSDGTVAGPRRRLMPDCTPPTTDRAV